MIYYLSVSLIWYLLHQCNPKTSSLVSALDLILKLKLTKSSENLTRLWNKWNWGSINSCLRRLKVSSIKRLICKHKLIPYHSILRLWYPKCWHKWSPNISPHKMFMIQGLDLQTLPAIKNFEIAHLSKVWSILSKKQPMWIH